MEQPRTLFSFLLLLILSSSSSALPNSPPVTDAADGAGNPIDPDDVRHGMEAPERKVPKGTKDPSLNYAVKDKVGCKMEQLAGENIDGWSIITLKKKNQESFNFRP